MFKVYALALAAVTVLVVLVWYFFIQPLGSQHHERQLEMIRKKIEQRERRRQESGQSSEKSTNGRADE